MKDLALRILMWAWIASLFGAVIAIYATSWKWTLAIVAYAIVTMIVAGIIRVSSRTGTTKQTSEGPAKQDP
jgi:membrane protein implicated in regulation of membrane protease activity